MIYPLVSEYIDAIKSSAENFDQLSDLTPVKDLQRNPVMSTGNYSVVFKMVNRTTGKLYAVKCFTKEQTGREYSYKEISEELEYVTTSFMTDVQYLEKELFVYSTKTTEREFPVVIMDWVEGVSLSEYLKENLSRDDIYALALSFSEMSMWLISQPFSHGDIKPDNIIVRDDKTLVLVDYDGMYLPSMKGQPAREIGTPDFRHPFRNKQAYDEHIDDFSIVIILLSLMLIHEDSSLLDNNRKFEGLLFSERDFYDLNKCGLYQKLKQQYNNNPLINNQFTTFEKCLEQGYLSKTDIYKIKLPEIAEYSIVQGDIAASKIAETLWRLSKKSYIRELNLTDNVLRFSTGDLELKFVTYNKKIYVGTTIQGVNYMYGYSYESLKRLLMSAAAWDKSIESKIMILYNEIQFSMPELMLAATRTFIERNFPNLADQCITTISGYTLTIAIVGCIDNIEVQHFVYNMLSDSVYKKNCERFGLKKILVIESITGKQLPFDVKNL